MKLNSKSEVSSEQLGARRFQPSTFNLQPSRRGIALVITLIMLSVTLVMAIAFIAVSRRSRNAATTGTDSTVARLAADAALAAVQAQIVANIFVTNTSAYDFRLLVSTNYQNAFGYVPTLQNPTNVNYDYRNDRNPLNADDFVQNVANLFFLPRVPVSIYNRATGLTDFRYFLDLNRNGQFENSGYVTNVDNLGNALADGSGNAFVSVIGDPQWVGILERPDSPHSADNHFVARYAFFAQPTGNSLDLNAIHNQTLSASAVNPFSAANDGYFRNESVGSWELNLASFLADLNTNQWNPIINPYVFRRPSLGNIGAAFEDAQSILAWRYGNNYNLLDAPSLLGYNALVNAGIDGYNIGDWMTNTALPFVQTPINTHWVGSDNTNRFYSLPSELFDSAKSSPNFVNRLKNAGTSFFGGTTNSTYDRYTFYRLLEQLGTDSVVDDTRMNLNYNNLTRALNGVVNVNGTASATNLLAWTPLTFFTNAADRMLKFSTAQWLGENDNGFYNFTNTFGAIITIAFGVTHIPVYVNGRFVYTPAVNRQLQLAANLYDATTNDFFPSVFRPLFTRTGTNVFITGYTNILTVSGTADFVFSEPTNVESFAQVGGVNIPINIYGVPWIIGAKKNLPNFNEFSIETDLAVTRRLQFTRDSLATTAKASTITGTNQMYTMSLDTSLGVEFWNSYSNSYNGTVVIGLNANGSVVITNDDHGFRLLFNKQFSTNIVFTTSSWAGTAPSYAGNPNSSSFISFLFTGPILTNSVYRSSFAAGPYIPAGFPYPIPGFVGTNYFGISSGTPLLFEANSPNGFYLPQFGLLQTNRLQLIMLDVTNGVYHILDYVHFAGPDSSFNVNSNLADGDRGDSIDHAFGVGIWDTNYPAGSIAPTGPNYGIINQISVSKNGAPPNEDGLWKADPEAVPKGGTIQQQQAFFQAFFKPGNRTITPVPATNLQLNVQAPYSPTRHIVQYFTWQVNDPLVHYLASDIDYAQSPVSSTTPRIGINHYNPGTAISPLTGLNLGYLNNRYLPWGGNPALSLEQRAGDTNRFNLAERDSLVKQSDNWNFPINKFPSSGWMGRVHRGTPWQTVYLKSADILADNNLITWQNWTGDYNSFDATNNAPLQDRLIFDVFTAAPNDNAQRGTLSVNQTGIASVSALFSGLVALTNDTSAGVTPSNSWVIIQPAGVDATNSAINFIQKSIAATRGNTNLFPQGVFKHVGDILRVPAITAQSPFLNWQDEDQAQAGISDELYEWLPQQTMGLLRLGTPRFVVYCYGQALKPAQNGIVLGGQFSQLVTNYQVVAESATRVVLRVDNAAGTNGSPRVVIESSTPLAPQ